MSDPAERRGGFAPGAVPDGVLGNREADEDVGPVDLLVHIHADLPTPISSKQTNKETAREEQTPRVVKTHPDSDVELLGVELLDGGRDAERDLEIVSDAVVENDELAVRRAERDLLQVRLRPRASR